MDKRAVIIPTDEEDAAINRGIAADPDTFEATPEWFAEARHAIEVVPEMVAAQEVGKMRYRGKQKAPTKQLVTLRMDADVLAALRASGPGWQKRLNDIARNSLAVRPAA